MDPLSSLAAASQLTAQGIQIIELACKLYKKYHDPETMKRQLKQVQQMIDLSVLIEKNAALQTPEVANILFSCYQSTLKLYEILKIMEVKLGHSRFSRLQKSLSALMREDEVAGLFDDLEREKSALLLCMTNINASLAQQYGSEAAQSLSELSIKITEGFATLQEQQSFKDSEASTLATKESICYFVPNGRRAKRFVGRRDVLERLDEAFSLLDQTPAIFVIHALGGQGKSQIALEYCRQAKTKEIPIVLWIDASSESSLKKSFRSVSTKMGGPEIEDSAVDFVLNRLGDSMEPWLMVLDNYDDPVAFDSIRDFIPENDQGSVLVTSRHKDAEYLANNEDNVLELPPLTEPAALDLLWSQCRIKSSEKDLGHATKIVKILAYHPLAITQAGSYIQKYKIRLANFLDLYQTKRDKIMNYTPHLLEYRRQLSQNEKETTLNVFTTWELSFQQLLQNVESGELKSKLLTLFAFFGRDDVSEELFEVYCNYAPKHPTKDVVKYSECIWPVPFLELCLKPEKSKSSSTTSKTTDTDVCVRAWDHDRYQDIVVEFAQLSLIQSWSRGVDNLCHFSLHPLVQDWIKLRLELDEYYQFYVLAASVMCATLWNSRKPGEMIWGSFSFLARQAVITHFLAHIENMKWLSDKLPSQYAIDNSTKELHYYEHELACYLYLSSAEYHIEALALANRSLHFREANFDPTTAEYARAHRLITEIMLESDECDFDALLSQSKELLERFERLRGPDDAETLWTLTTVAIFLWMTGETKECEVRMRRANTNVQKNFPADSTLALCTSACLGGLLLDRDELVEAEEIWTQYLKISESHFGPQSQPALKARLFLGEVINSLGGRFEEAERMLKPTVETYAESRGPRHWSTVRGLINLSIAALGLEKMDEGRNLMREAVIGILQYDDLNGPEVEAGVEAAWQEIIIILAKLTKNMEERAKEKLRNELGDKEQMEEPGAELNRSTDLISNLNTTNSRLKFSHISKKLSLQNTVQTLRIASRLGRTSRVRRQEAGYYRKPESVFLRIREEGVLM